jgi:zinc transport system permease protein
MFSDFMLRAALAGLGVVLAAAPLGCFVVWRRMAFFGAATAHAAVLGVALSLALSISLFVGVLAVSLLMAVMVTLLSGRGYAMDTLLGVMAHASLAFGLVAVSFITDVRIDLMAYLFGDILAVGNRDVIIIWGGSILVIALMMWRWPSLLLATVSDDLAYAEGFRPQREELILTVSLAIVVAVAIKVVGVLLIAALLIIPAATARPLSSTPEQMAIGAAAIGAVAVLGGLWGSWHLDTPTGPTIVCVSAILFALVNLLAHQFTAKSVH